MNIVCDRCKTQFRFDDALMEASGVWLRCSRCQNVFFQKNPAEQSQDNAPEAKPAVDRSQMTEVSAFFNEQSFKERITDPTEENPSDVKYEDTVQLFVPTADRDKPVVPPGESILDEIEKDVAPVDSEDISEEDLHPYDEEDEGDGDKGKKEGRFTWKLVVLIMLINLLIGGGVYLFFFPEISNQVLSSIRSIPVIQYIFGVEKQPGDVNPGLIKIKDVTNRYVNSYFTDGVPLLVVEGRAVNKSEEILTRIRIQGKVYDGTNRILQMRMTYCGNSLTDEELGGLQETEIQRRLSMPQDVNVSKDRVLPNREIPFMMIFAIDKAGVDKRAPVVTGVIPVSSERLLN